METRNHSCQWVEIVVICSPKFILGGEDGVGRYSRSFHRLRRCGCIH